MIRYLPTRKRTGCGRALKPSEDFNPVSARLSEAVATLSEPAPCSLSRADFMEALRLLGTRRSDRRLRGAESTRLMLPVHVSCSYERWVAFVGQPESVEKYKTLSLQMAIAVWKHHCADGPVTCIGHLFERSSGERWVTVVRVGLC